MIDADTADRIRVFVEGLMPEVRGFNLVLRFDDRMEMVGANFDPREVIEVLEGMLHTAETGEYPPPIIN